MELRRAAGIITFIFIHFLLVLESSAQKEKAQMLVNGRVFNQTECQKLSDLESIKLIESGDSLSVEVYLASGALGKGAKSFQSTELFNSFDIVTWLKSERRTGNTISVAFDTEGDSQTKLAAREGDRLIVLIYRGKRMVENYVLVFCR